MKNVAFLFLIFFEIGVNAQELPDALVKSIVGRSEVKHNGKLMPLKMGSLIYKTDVLMVKSGSHLILANHDNKYFEILKPGTYIYADILKNIEAKPTGIVKEYFDLMWEDLVHHGTAINNGKSIGNAVGGPVRGNLGCDNLVEPPDMLNTIDDTLKFLWHAVPGMEKYKFSLSRNGSKEIVQVITKDTFLILLKNPLLEAGKTRYYWNVSDQNEKCAKQPFSLTLYSARMEEELTNELVKQVIKDDNRFIWYLKVSQVLAEQGWLSKSYQYYLKAKAEFVKIQQ